ncbi:hypothetical protein CC2G_005041 [Coprinopsis cinerea AmutBmut pab1-1]|nr:hypothetical protein CC2G_005041 [Coprinopsis cinerea AmutBmut pab1-1]
MPLSTGHKVDTQSCVCALLVGPVRRTKPVTDLLDIRELTSSKTRLHTLLSETYRSTTPEDFPLQVPFSRLEIHHIVFPSSSFCTSAASDWRPLSTEKLKGGQVMMVRPTWKLGICDPEAEYGESYHHQHKEVPLAETTSQSFIKL